MSRARWLQDKERHVRYRADYLERTTEFDEKRARVLAHRELGYSVWGIVKWVDQIEPAVKGYLVELAVRYGQHGVETRHPGEIAVNRPVEPVGREDILAWPVETREWWRDLAEKYPACAPEWFDRTVALGGEA